MTELGHLHASPSRHGHGSWTPSNRKSVHCKDLPLSAKGGCQPSKRVSARPSTYWVSWIAAAMNLQQAKGGVQHRYAGICARIHTGQFPNPVEPKIDRVRVHAKASGGL